MATRSLADRLLPAKLKLEIQQLLDKHNKKRSDKEGICSLTTQKHRREIIRLSIAQLWEDGYQLETVTSLKGKHIEHLMGRWDQAGLSASMLHTRLSVLRTLSKWLRKPEICKDLGYYLNQERTHRSTVAVRNLAWEAKGIDVDAAIRTASDMNERFGLMLATQRAFGLRAREVMEFRPLEAVIDDGKRLMIVQGTKGGRPRMVTVATDRQRGVLAQVVKLVGAARNARLRWPDCTYQQARNRYYNFMKRLGATKAGMGVTGHGLRHAFAQEMYRRQTGLPTPIEGGKPSGLSRGDHMMATMGTSIELGHGRPDVMGSYCGSYGHAQRTVQTPSRMTYSFIR